LISDKEYNAGSFVCISIQENLQWDWVAFSQDIVSSLIGFTLAIISALMIDKIKKIFDKKECIKGIIEELKDILESLGRITDEIDTQFISPIGSDYWNSTIINYKMRLIHEKKWFVELSKIYSKVKEINEWLKLKTQYSSYEGNYSDQDTIKRFSFATVLQKKIISENDENSDRSLRCKINRIIETMNKEI